MAMHQVQCQQPLSNSAIPLQSLLAVTFSFPQKRKNDDAAASIAGALQHSVKSSHVNGVMLSWQNEAMVATGICI